MRRKSISFPLLFFAFLVTTILYQNCAKTPFGSMGMHADLSSSAVIGFDEPDVVTIPYALLSSEQVFKSMSSVTGVSPTPAIVNEYNSRQTILGSGYDLKLVTSPMLIGITNLSSTFCNQLIVQEMAQAADTRRFFSQVDFAKPVSTLSEEAFAGTLQKFSLAFWGRGLTTDESEILGTGKSEFLAALSDAERNQNASTRNLMLFTCSGMLSSFDAVTF